MKDSANVSRRSEERLLISANELLRFPLDEVLVLPEGQNPIRARHVRYYEDRHFRPIEAARMGKRLPNVEPRGTVGTAANVAIMAVSCDAPPGEALADAKSAFDGMSTAAQRGTRRVPKRKVGSVC